MRVTLSTGSEAELARPGGEPASTAVVLWADIFDLRPLFDRHAQRLADELGAVVVAPAIFPGSPDLGTDARFAAAAALSDVDKLSDLDAAIDATGLDTAATLGFCIGGMYAMKSLASSRVERAVAFYGMIRMPEVFAGPGQGDAIDVVRARRPVPPLLGLYGTDDPFCPEHEIDELESVGATVVRYPHAGHGWAQDPERDNYRPAEAADAWRRATDYLRG
ncbi:MAG: dienelactone hydrolase family protein [Microthrixaceae bacterium]